MQLVAKENNSRARDLTAYYTAFTSHCCLERFHRTPHFCGVPSGLRFSSPLLWGCRVARRTSSGSRSNFWSFPDHHTNKWEIINHDRQSSRFKGIWVAGNSAKNFNISRGHECFSIAEMHPKSNELYSIQRLELARKGLKIIVGNLSPWLKAADVTILPSSMR